MRLSHFVKHGKFSNVRQREKKLSNLSLVKVNPEIWKLRKEQKLRSKFETTEKICVKSNDCA